MASLMNSTEYLKCNNKTNQLLKKVKVEEIFPNSFYEHSITITNVDRNIIRKLQTEIPTDSRVLHKTLKICI